MLEVYGLTCGELPFKAQLARNKLSHVVGANQSVLISKMLVAGDEKEWCAKTKIIVDSVGRNYQGD